MEFSTGRKVYPPAWRCIYCPDDKVKDATKRRLGKEHIIPYGLGGEIVYPRSSCKKCSKITGKTEETCQHIMLGPTRIRLDLPTRNPQDRPTELTLVVAHKNGPMEERRIPASDFPLVIPGLKLPPAGILTGEAPHNNNVGEFWCKYPTADLEKLSPTKDKGFRLASFNNLIFARMLAKIAHAYAVAEYGLNSFEPLLLDLILGRSEAAFHLIGGDMTVLPPDPRGLHKLEIEIWPLHEVSYVIVRIQLFCLFGSPRYDVVVGRYSGQSD